MINYNSLHKQEVCQIIYKLENMNCGGKMCWLPNLKKTPAVMLSSFCLCFYIQFIQLEAFSDSCAEMSLSKLELM